MGGSLTRCIDLPGGSNTGIHYIYYIIIIFMQFLVQYKMSIYLRKYGEIQGQSDVIRRLLFSER